MTDTTSNLYMNQRILQIHMHWTPRLKNNVGNYYMPEEFSKLGNERDTTSAFHLTAEVFLQNWEAFQNLICVLHTDPDNKT